MSMIEAEHVTFTEHGAGRRWGIPVSASYRLEWGESLIGSGASWFQPPPVEVRLGTLDGCLCPLCVGVRSFVEAPAPAPAPDPPTYDLDAADLRRYVQQHQGRVFNISDPYRCLLASVLREQQGHLVGVGVDTVRVNGEWFRWIPWATALQHRLLGIRWQWRGADILPVLDAVLAEHGIVVEPEPGRVDDVPPADDVDDAVIVAPRWRARHALITRLPGTPRHDQVDDRRPAVYRHLVE